MSSAGTGWIKKLKLSSNGPGFQLYMILHHKQPATSPITSMVFLSLSHSLSWWGNLFIETSVLFFFFCVCVWGVCEDQRDWSLTDRHHVCVYVVVCLNVSVRTNPQIKALGGKTYWTRVKKVLSLLWSLSLCSSHIDIETHLSLVTWYRYYWY